MILYAKYGFGGRLKTLIREFIKYFGVAKKGAKPLVKEAAPVIRATSTGITDIPKHLEDIAYIGNAASSYEARLNRMLNRATEIRVSLDNPELPEATRRELVKELADVASAEHESRTALNIIAATGDGGGTKESLSKSMQLMDQQTAYLGEMNQKLAYYPEARKFLEDNPVDATSRIQSYFKAEAEKNRVITDHMNARLGTLGTDRPRSETLAAARAEAEAFYNELVAGGGVVPINPVDRDLATATEEAMHITGMLQPTPPSAILRKTRPVMWEQPASGLGPTSALRGGFALPLDIKSSTDLKRNSFVPYEVFSGGIATGQQFPVLNRKGGILRK